MSTVHYRHDNQISCITREAASQSPVQVITVKVVNTYYINWTGHSDKSVSSANTGKYFSYLSMKSYIVGTH